MSPSVFNVPASSPPTVLTLGCGSNHSLGITFAFKTGKNGKGNEQKRVCHLSILFQGLFLKCDTVTSLCVSLARTVARGHL